jgi:hypothetical protein
MENNTTQISILAKIEKIREVVSDYLSKNKEYVGLNRITELQTNHIIDVGTSILCTKWEIGYAGGGFVQAVVNNDLRNAFGRADSTSIRALQFYCQLMYNVGMPTL